MAETGPIGQGRTPSEASVFIMSIQAPGFGTGKNSYLPDSKRQLRAAQYLRMSTEHQNFSTANQVRAIAAYAEARNIEIVRTYADEGRSGLVIKRRVALQQLLRDVVGGTADFDIVVVYDVSRWGRFQDPDEAAHYEFLCKQAGIAVRYCAEPFENDATPMAAIMKALKRAMAAEFSRDLSVKVFAGLIKIIESGYHSGAPPAYGLRRVLVRRGQRTRWLEPGEIKELGSDRIVLVHGPKDEVETVRWIFERFVHDGWGLSWIADQLNIEGRPSPKGGQWAYATIRHMLGNEIYIGNRVWAKTDTKLQQPKRLVPPDRWIRKDQAVAPIVSREIFAEARRLIASSTVGLSNDEVIRRLQVLFAREGMLSHALIGAEDGLPTGTAIAQRFGSIDRAYALAGYVPRGSYRYASTTRLMRRLEDDAVLAISGTLDAASTPCAVHDRVWLTVGEGISLRVRAARPGLAKESGTRTWRMALTMAQRGDWTLVIRPDLERGDVFDFYLMPFWGFVLSRFDVGVDNGAKVDAFRLPDLPSVCAAIRDLRPPPPKESLRKGWSKYARLRQHLSERPEFEFEMTIDEIETLLGKPLPPSAVDHTWWENGKEERYRSAQAKAWMGAGCRAFFRGGTVLFSRDPERRRARGSSASAAKPAERIS